VISDATALRVLMTTDALGGVWTFSLELAGGLASQGAQVYLVVLGPAPTMEQRLGAEAVVGLRVIQARHDLEWRDRRGLDVPAARSWFQTLERAIAPDIVHVNGFREATFFAAPTVIVAHSCVATWWNACRQGELPASEWGAYLAGVRSGMAAADALVAPTRAFLQDFSDMHGQHPAALVIPNGRSKAPDLSEPRQREPVILSAGRFWDEAKNIAALERLAAAIPWPVMVAGGRPAEGKRSAIAWLGELPPAQLRECMARAEIFCAPVRFEPFGLAILEAAQAGAALVLSDLPTLREVWGDAALFAPVDDDEALEAALRALIEDHGLRRRMQGAAMERARQFPATRMADRYARLYRELIGTSASALAGAA
jgi:glycogen synthase